MTDIMTYAEFTRLVDDGIAIDAEVFGGSLRVWLTEDYYILPDTNKDWEPRACMQYFVQHAPVDTLLHSRLVQSVCFQIKPKAVYIGGLGLVSPTIPTKNVTIKCTEGLVRADTVAWYVTTPSEYTSVNKKELIHEDVQQGLETKGYRYSTGYEETMVPNHLVREWYRENT